MYIFGSESVIPVRKEASESSEMVTQLLFGEVAVLLEEKENWYYVQNLEDGYKGWLTSYMVTHISEEQLFSIKSWQYVHSYDTCLELADGSLMFLPLGSRIPVFNKDENEIGKMIEINGKKWQLRNNGTFRVLPLVLLHITAKKFMNIPYLWGGKSSFGIDCSGFTQTLFKMHGILLPRDASQQALEGEEVPFDERRSGDLAFFSKAEKPDKITHVGFLMSPDEIIHCSGKVKIDLLNQNGIYSYEYQKHSHSIVLIKRYFQWDH